MKRKVLAGVLLMGVFFATPLSAIEYTQKDRGMIIEIRTKLHEIDKHFGSIHKRFDDLKWYMGTITAIATAILSALIIYVMRQDAKIERVQQAKIDLLEIASALYIADGDTKKKFREALKA